MTERQFWALVTDGARARVLRDIDAETAGRVAPADLAFRARSEALRRLVAEGPSGFEAPSTSAADQLHQDLRCFVEEISAILDCHRLAGDFTMLALLAPHHVLRVMRSTFPAGLQNVVAVELAIDLLRLSDPDLRRKVRAALQKVV